GSASPRAGELASSPAIRGDVALNGSAWPTSGEPASPPAIRGDVAPIGSAWPVSGEPGPPAAMGPAVVPARLADRADTALRWTSSFTRYLPLCPSTRCVLRSIQRATSPRVRRLKQPACRRELFGDCEAEASYVLTEIPANPPSGKERPGWPRGTNNEHASCPGP